MIILDEAIHGPGIAGAIAAWYAGRVVSIAALRPKTVVKDDAVTMLLRSVSFPTFVTINVADFWRQIPAAPDYCVVCAEVTGQQVFTLPGLLRRLLRLDEFKTKGPKKYNFPTVTLSSFTAKGL